MSGYLKQRSQALDARSKSIEGRKQEDSTYTRFLEDQIMKFNKRESEFDKMQARMIDIQTKFDKLLTNEVKLEADSSTRNKAISKLEDKMQGFQGIAERIDHSEQLAMNRYIGRREVTSF